MKTEKSQIYAKGTYMNLEESSNELFGPLDVRLLMTRRKNMVLWLKKKGENPQKVEPKKRSRA